MADSSDLTDAQLLAVAKSGDSSLLRSLNANERQRMIAMANQPEAKPRTWTDTAVDSLPAVGGAVGGLLGGLTGIPSMGLTAVPGAIAGASILGGGGEASKQLINRFRGRPAPPTMADAATDIGIQGGVQGAFEGAGQVAMPALKAGATAVYRGYLKPSLARVNLSKATQIVKDAMAEGLPVTEGGLQQARDVIGQLNGKVNDLLSRATGNTVDLGAMANEVRAWATRMFDRPGRDPRDLKAALAVADRIDQHPSLSVAKDVDMVTANQVKRDVQKSAADKFGVPTGSAETATEKKASSVLREGIEAQVPEVGPLNARQSRLLDVAKAIERATGREANKSPLIGVNTLASAAVGGEEMARTHDPAAAAAKALAVRMALSPAVMTRAAIVAARLAEKLPGTAVADIARVAVQVASEAKEEP